MGVKIIANQKVVGVNVKKLFQDYGIIVLERFGRKGIERLRYISRCNAEDPSEASSQPYLLETLSDVTLSGSSDHEVVISFHITLLTAK